MGRRAFVAAAGLTGLGATGSRVEGGDAPRPVPDGDSWARPGPGRLHQSVCRWPFERIPLEDFCREARDMGLEAMDLLYPDEWAVAH